MRAIVEVDVDDSVRVLNLIDVFQKIGLEQIQTRVVAPRAGCQPACYFGCLLTPPPDIVRLDDPEHPTSMERILKTCGADPVAWNLKTECCGAGMTLANEATVLELSHRILSDARAHGATCIVVACPRRHVNLDMKQAAIERHYDTQHALPVYCLTDLVTSCSPHMHLRTFRKAAESAGLNPYLVDMANIREHCSWVHQDREDATHKAIELVRMAVAKVRRNRALQPIRVPVTRRALVIGGGVAGIQAALVIGPPVMVRFTLPALAQLGLPDDKIYTSLENRMKCGVGKCGRCNCGPFYVCKDGPVLTLEQLQRLPADY